ncbi:MAG: IS30 family transposase [Deltaproteobacteria bacterium]|nr:IS30 family transposase [Deltaproteobacteria bacterium]
MPQLAPYDHQPGDQTQSADLFSGLCIYFADPYSAWQRGCNENKNGLLRKYFPKGMNFSNMTNEDLALAVKKLNRRPRKCLYYQTPYEVFYSAIRGALAS